MATNEPLRKITVSVPAALVDFADQQADELQTSRSQVIAMALATAKSRQEEQLAAEGYRFYADEARDFAVASDEAVAEAWTTSWSHPEHESGNDA